MLCAGWTQWGVAVGWRISATHRLATSHLAGRCPPLAIAPGAHEARDVFAAARAIRALSSAQAEPGLLPSETEKMNIYSGKRNRSAISADERWAATLAAVAATLAAKWQPPEPPWQPPRAAPAARWRARGSHPGSHFRPGGSQVAGGWQPGGWRVAASFHALAATDLPGSQGDHFGPRDHLRGTGS